MDAPVDLDATRERIRFICAQEQAQWRESWTEVLSAPTSIRRGLVLPDVFIQTLQANGVFCGRPEARALVQRFQTPNGAVSVSNFLQWVALTAPADHVDPELRFPRLPQPYRRIAKVLEQDILDVAWAAITAQSERYRAEAAGGGGAWTARSASGSGVSHASPPGDDDFHAAKKRTATPERRVAVAAALEAPIVVALRSHVSAPFAAAVVSEQRAVGIAVHRGRHVLQLVSTSRSSRRPSSNSSSSSDEATTIPLEWWEPGDRGSSEGLADPQDTQAEVHVGSVSALQPLPGSACGSGPPTSWCVAVRLVKETTCTTPAADPESPPTTTTTTSGQVSVLLVDSDGSTDAVACHHVAVMNDGDSDASAAVELSQDLRFLARSSAARGISLVWLPSVDDWRQQSVGNTEVDAGSDTDGAKTADEGASRLSPPVDLSDTPRLELGETATGVVGDDAERPPLLHFLVAPVTTSVAASHSSAFAGAPTVYALVASVGSRVLKFLLPGDPSSCQSVAPLVRWEHLSAVTASSVDASTELLAVACADGSLVVWNVLRDRGHAFMAARAGGGSNASSIIDAVMYREGAVVALSTGSQRVWFFDARSRHAPSLVRVVTPPSSAASAAQSSSASQPSVITITGLVAGTSALGIPVAILHYSTGFSLLYDTRTARAIGSVRTSSALMSASSSALCGVGRVGSSETQPEAFDIYAWGQLVPAGFQDEEGEVTGTESHASSPQRLTGDPLALMYRLAGKHLPSPSPSAPKLKAAMLPTASSHLEQAEHASVAVAPLALQPCTPDWRACFQQLCDERLEPQGMADRDAALMRRQRAILKAVAAALSS